MPANKPTTTTGDAAHRRPTARGAPTKVVKKLAPGQPGTVRLVEQYGESLVCVRHRHDDNDLYRWTTVELIVDQKPVRGSHDPWLLVRIGRLEHSVREAVSASGGRWSPDDHLWQVPRSVVRNLGLTPRIVRSIRAKR